MAYSGKKFKKAQVDEFFKQYQAFWNASTHMMEPAFDVVNDCERLWRAQLPEELEAEMESHPDRAALAPPDIYMNIKSLRASLKKLLFSRKPYAQLTKEGNPGKKEDYLEKAEWILQNMLDIQHKGRGFKSEADKIIHQALYAGVTATFTRWVELERKKPVRNPETQELVRNDDGAVIFEPHTVASYAETVGIDIRRVRIDPAADDIDQIRIVGWQSLTNLSDLIAKNRNPNSFYDFDEAELMASSFSRDEYFKYITGESEAYPEKTTQNEGFGDKIVEKREIRGLFRIEKPDGSMEMKDLVVVVANDSMIIGIKENDLPIPGYELFDFPSVDQELSRFFTMGLVEPMMDTWIEFFIKRNQSLDEATRRTYDTYIGDKNSCEDLPDIIEHEAGKINMVDLVASGIDDVRKVLAPMPRPSFGQDTFLQAQALRTELRQGMGQNSYSQGLDPQRKETATGVNELVEGSNDLLLNIAEVLTDRFFAPAWRKHLILYNFFRGHEKRDIHTDSGKALTVLPGEIDFYYLIDVEAKTTSDRPMMQRRWIEAFPLMKQSPNYDQYEIDKTHLEILDIPNKDKILLSPAKLKDDVERENIALLNGVQIFVSEHDNDPFHLEEHQVARDEAAQRGFDVRTFDVHIQEHQVSLENKQKAQLGNTKDLGGNAAAVSNANAGAIKPRLGVGGGGLPSGSRT